MRTSASQPASGPSASLSRRCRTLTSFLEKAGVPGGAPSPTHDKSASSPLGGRGGGDDGDEDEGHISASPPPAPAVHRFLAGTAEVMSTGGNAMVMLEYDEEERAVNTVGTPFAYDSGEIWSLAPRPVLNADDSRAVLACFLSRKGVRGMSLSTVQGARGLTVRTQLEESEGAWAVAWNRRGNRAASAHQDGSVKIWRPREDGEDMAVEVTGAATSASAATMPGASTLGLPSPAEGEARDIAWDPMEDDLVVIARGFHAVGVDTRQPATAAFEIATKGKCRSVDVNPNRPHYILTAGDEGAVRFWDARKTAEPVQSLSRGGHSHWITKARYNPFHDQLVLTGSTDGLVCLWRAASVSSAPISADADLVLGVEEDHGMGMDYGARSRDLSSSRSEQDGLVKAYDEHKHESVFGVAWSAVDAWVFASVSYDGKLFARSVPSATKYQILL